MWVNDQGGFQNAANVLYARVSDTAPTGEALKKTLSAEVHSLVRLGVNNNDRVILLSSETTDGKACAFAVKYYLDRYFVGLECTVDSVDGLQVHDAERFRRTGIVNFVGKCLNAVNQFGNTHSILNPTGGFKALMPYAVLVGMLKKVPCKYIFEQSTTLLTLPPFPIAIDRGSFESYRTLLNKIERETHLPIDAWNQSIPYADRELLEPLIEVCDKQVTLSGVGLLFLDELQKPTSLVPFLSRQAWNDCYDTLCKLKECDPFEFLIRIAKDQAAFKRYEHINSGSGLRWMKPGNTTDRYLVSIDGWRLLVWRVIREDQEGTNYPNKVKVNPTVDRKNFGPFTRLEFAETEI